MTPSKRQVLVSLALLAILDWIANRIPLADSATIVRASQVYIRSGPGTDFEPNGVLNEGETVAVLESSGSWVRIRTQGGGTGFVHQAYVAGAPNPEAAEIAEPAPPPNAVTATVPAPVEPEIRAEPIVEELAALRAEIQRLRLTLDRLEPTNDQPIVIPTAGVLGPASSMDGPTPRVGLVAVGLVSLGAGWMLGAILSRRRTHSQRSRLRF